MDTTIPSVTSLQCVNALMTLGFEIADFDDRVVTLVGADGRRVFVRRHATLTGGEIKAILIVASVSVEAFVAAIARRGSATQSLVDGPGTSGVRERDVVMDEVDRLLRLKKRAD